MYIQTKSKRSVRIHVDKVVYDIARKYKLLNRKSGSTEQIYAVIEGKITPLQNLIFKNKGQNEVVIFRNGDKLDFTMKNLLLVDKAIHSHKKGKSKGIYYCNTLKKWIVRVNKGEKAKSEHTYFLKTEAMVAADYLSWRKYGSNANLNYPELTFQEITEKYCLIRDKYGWNKPENKSKAQQGRKPVNKNASNYVGVSRNKKGCKKEWVARIKKDKKTYGLGAYYTEVEAAKAYDKKAREIYGIHAKTNF